MHAKCYRGDAWFHLVFWLLGANCIFYSFFYKQELIQSAVTKANSSASRLKAMAKIYGKTGNKLSLYQKSVNNAAVEIAKDQPELVLDKGMYSYCMLSYRTTVNTHIQEPTFCKVSPNKSSYIYCKVLIYVRVSKMTSFSL